MAPVVANIQKDYEGKVEFKLFDVEKNSLGSRLMRELGQAYVPAFYVVDENHEVVEKWTGERDEQEIRDLLDTIAK